MNLKLIKLTATCTKLIMFIQKKLKEKIETLDSKVEIMRMYW